MSITKWLSGKGGSPPSPEAGTAPSGADAEMRALEHLRRHGMTLVARNYRVANGRGRRAGEIDLIVRDADGTLVFVEVRSRSTDRFGGAAASVGSKKQASIVFAAHHYLRRVRGMPPCRFDVVAIDGARIEWLPAAFSLDG